MWGYVLSKLYAQLLCIRSRRTKTATGNRQADRKTKWTEKTCV